MNEKIKSITNPVPEPFLEKTVEFANAKYILFGVPIDITTSYRSGTRFAPASIRHASHHMESYSIRRNLDWQDLHLTDIGDITSMKDVDRTIEYIENVIEDIQSTNKFPVMIGGEHTITLGAIRSLAPEAVIVFDAHLDLRDVLYGQRLCHATYLRRAHEEKKFKLIIIGARALSNEEIDYAEKNNINVITSRDIKTFGTGPIINMLKDELDKIESIYLSIDMDVIDPSEAPAVGNPCPEGISVTDLLDILEETIDNRFIGFDLNEVSPTYDSGITSIQAAYVILETLYIKTKSEKHNIDE